MMSHHLKKSLTLTAMCVQQFQHTKTIGIRTLYSSASLGIDNYLNARERVKSQFKDIESKFKEKMAEFVSGEKSNMVFTEDLKNMVHIIDNNEADVKLFEDMAIKFAQQNNDMRFGSFIFGPVVMRMYHFLNLPSHALKMFKHPDLAGFFDQLISFQILMDLLYENEMYQEVLEVFDMVQEKQLKGSKFPKNSVVLAFAACYKMNTPESYQYAKKLWSDLNSVGHYPMRRAATLAAALAIAQNDPYVALEIISSVRQQTYVTVRNIKVAALAELNRPDDALPILRSVLTTDSNSNTKHTFYAEVIERVKQAVDRSNNPDVANEFERIHQQLSSLRQIVQEPLDAMLCSEIVGDIFNKNSLNDRNSSFRASGGFRKKDRPQSTNFAHRPGLRDMI